ncbi:uncharacterized protein [Phyllobates terribilis]|uniref:uncharacterized protein isoform X3 n=1 Tax=Phyllobates terribilis TaxID=111132 RepID=UPI003CCB5ABA
MGSGSSKSKRRVINFCSQQLLRPTEITEGESTIQGSVDCKQNEKDDGRTSKATQPGLEMEDSRFPPDDPDLQLLDDILTESEDCLSWQEPICKGQKMTASPHTDGNPDLLSQCQENQKQGKKVPRILQTTTEIQPESSESRGTQHRVQHIEDSKTIADTAKPGQGKVLQKEIRALLYQQQAPGTTRVFDLENNNLPISTIPHGIR